MATGARWRLDEFVLCLDLYLKEGPVGNSHPAVLELAGLIGRTPGAVAHRLANFQFVDPNKTGPGLEGGERDCRPIWDLLGDRPETVAGLAALAKHFLD